MKPETLKPETHFSIMVTTTFQGKQIASFPSGNDSQTLPTVLLHGFCEDSRMWDEWLPMLPPQRQYLCVDLPGFGQSELLSDTTIESMADAVVAVLEAHRIEKCVLIGHSMGGYVALALAEKNPGLLAGLCLFHSHPFADAEDKKAARLKSIEFIKTNGSLLFVRQLIPKFFNYDYSKGYPAEVNRMIFYATQYSTEAIIASTLAMRDRPDRSPILQEIKCPVQFIIGQKDQAVPFDLSLEAAHLPDLADIRIYPDVGHMGMFKSPHPTSKAFKEFLKWVEEMKV